MYFIYILVSENAIKANSFMNELRKSNYLRGFSGDPISGLIIDCCYNYNNCYVDDKICQRCMFEQIEFKLKELKNKYNFNYTFFNSREELEKHIKNNPPQYDFHELNKYYFIDEKFREAKKHYISYNTASIKSLIDAVDGELVLNKLIKE